MKLFTIILVLITIVILASCTPSTTPSAQCGSAVLVQPGDTIASIAERCGLTDEQILAANPGLIDNPEIVPGRVVFMPNQSAVTVPHSVVVTQVVPVTGAEVVIPVQPTPLPQTVVIVPQPTAVPQTVLVMATQAPQVSAMQSIPVTGAFNYLIQPGDTLSSLAVRYNTSIQAIMSANPQITDADLIYAGHQLTIPGNPGGNPIPVTGGSGQVYTIQPGDNLTRIALRFNTSIESILAANPKITDPHWITAGDSLVIPGAQPVPVTGSPVYYTQSGDSLTSVARKFALSLETLLGLNPQLDRLPTGTTVILPVQPTAQPTAQPTPLPTASSIPVTGAQVIAAPNTALPGQEITLSAQGLPASAALDVSLGPLNQPAAVTYAATSAPDGTLNARVTIPAGAQAGQQWVIVLSTASLKVASNPITIAGAAPTLAPNAAPTQAAVPANAVQVYLIERGAGMLACGDRVAPALRQVTSGGNGLADALQALLSLDQQLYGPTPLYNALFASDLTLERIDLQGTHADIYLTGQYRVDDVCDPARIQAQIEATARQYGVESSVVFVNGQPVQ